jgi:hypothetical protein
LARPTDPEPTHVSSKPLDRRDDDDDDDGVGGGGGAKAKGETRTGFPVGCAARLRISLAYTGARCYAERTYSYANCI